MLGERGGSFPFFIVQAFGITLEDAVVDIACMIRPKLKEAHWTKVVGYVWTIIWFSWSTVLYADWLIQIGVLRSEPGPLPIVAPVMRLVGIDVYDIQYLYSPITPGVSG